MTTPRRAVVLIADADASNRRAIALPLTEAGYSIAEAYTFTDALERLEGFAYDAMVVNVRMPGGDGFDILDNARAKYPRMPCLVTSEFGSIHHAVRALKSGALDYLLKPVSGQVVVETLAKALQAAEPVAAPAPVIQETASFEGIIGGSPAMQDLFKTVGRVAPMHSTVLITGETGTGKELVARTIHDNSPRRDFPFVAFNAAAIPDGLAEAELFGHLKGAFTGAVYTRVGRFEAADRGTLFIDEIASMPLQLQAKVLRAIQEREVERLGGSRPIKVNTRIIAASNEDLGELVKAGRFREDLFYRLSVVKVDLPALRQRQADIPVLARHFIEDVCRTNGLQVKTLNQAALQALMSYHWPGNVRHLQNAVESAVVMSGSASEISIEHLPIELLAPQPSAAPITVQPVDAVPVALPETPASGINFASAMSKVERELILTYLRRANGNKRQAARMLSLSRTTLIDKLHRLGVTEPAEPPVDQTTEIAQAVA